MMSSSALRSIWKPATKLSSSVYPWNDEISRCARRRLRSHRVACLATGAWLRAKSYYCARSRFPTFFRIRPVWSRRHSLGTEQLSHDRPRPIDLVVSSQPVKQREVDRSQMPSRQSRRRQHVMPGTQPRSRGGICHGIPLRRTRESQSDTRAIRDARPPTVNRAGDWGRYGPTEFHNASGSCAVAKRCLLYCPTAGGWSVEQAYTSWT
jgi:hypothetical protein